jgi:hypothetical protein
LVVPLAPRPAAVSLLFAIAFVSPASRVLVNRLAAT